MEYLFKAGNPKRPPITDKALWLYGKGKLGKLAKEFCRVVGQKVDGVFDSTDTVPTAARIAVCVVTSPYNPIRRSLLDNGSVGDIWPFYDIAELYRGKHPLENGWYAEAFTSVDKSAIVNVLTRWDDEISRLHYTEFLGWRRLREEWLFEGAPVTLENLYFIPEIVSVLHDHEVFVDGGAHHGEVIAKFIELVGGKFKSVIAVEPDDANWGVLRWRPRQDRKIYLLHFALSDSNGVARFYEGFDLCSKLSEAGPVLKVTWKIDSLGLTPTFIKLHLEGGELKALHGAEVTMLKYRPIVAVNVDHNADGIYRTASYLMGLLKDYRFLFRNHCYCASNSVIYAIPNERIQGKVEGL
jgi:FkbM family methyltransferase